MFGNPSLTTRIAIGKGLGVLFGIAGFIFLTVYPAGTGELLRWGILLWYATFGAIIGVFGGHRGMDEFRADVLCL